MVEDRQQSAQRWFIKVQNDLASARKLAADPDVYLDTAIYHCQQAAEKALKGFLVFHGQKYDKIHDIRKLILSAVPLEAKFSPWVEKAAFLTSYASEFRYADEIMSPGREEFERALKIAEQLYAFVLSLLPKEVQP